MIQRYQPNNILFRIASSDALSKFKASQAHAFIQLARSELKFDTSAREVVLLEYDRISHWLYKIERLLLGLPDSKLTHELRHAITRGIIDEIDTVENVIANHSSIFTKGVNDFSRIIHGYAREILIEEIDKIDANENMGNVFITVTLLVTEYLQHVLACLHEYNNNCITKVSASFISISDFGLRCQNGCKKAFDPICRRLKFFRDVTGQAEYVFKNYLEDHEDPIDKVAAALDNTDITLIPEMVQVLERVAA
jgi:hypothetical protein